MDISHHTTVPLLGSLFVEAGLITREQLEVCLLLQSDDYLGVPLGQILLHCGYISPTDLERVLSLQAAFRAAVAQAPSRAGLLSTDLTAVLLAHLDAAPLIPLLHDLGVAVQHVTTATTLHTRVPPQLPDLLLIDPALLDPSTDLAAYALVPTLILPLSRTAAAPAAPLAEALPAALSGFIAQVREHREHRTALHDLQQRAFELNTIVTINRLVATSPTPSAAISRLMGHIRDHFRVEAGTLYRLDADAQQMIFEVVFGPQSEQLTHQRIPVARGIAGWVVRHRHPLLIPDAAQDPRFNAQIDQSTGFQTRAILSLPLIAFGVTQGVLQLINKPAGEHFSERELIVLRICATMLAITLAQCGMQETDPLTPSEHATEHPMGMPFDSAMGQRHAPGRARPAECRTPDIRRPSVVG